MGNSINLLMYDSSLIFVFLLCLEMAWNAVRFILICISSRYYFVIINHVRQIPSIRLSDFSESAAGELNHEFQEAMQNEYPGSGHRENVLWYAASSGACWATILLDILAISSVYFRSYLILVFWMCLYFAFSIFEVTTTCIMMRKCTNQLYLKRKWGYRAITCVLNTTFRCYLIWLSHGLPFTSSF